MALVDDAPDGERQDALVGAGRTSCPETQLGGYDLVRGRRRVRNRRRPSAQLRLAVRAIGAARALAELTNLSSDNEGRTGMRGQGRVYRPRVRGEPTAVWWLDYSVNGR